MEVDKNKFLTSLEMFKNCSKEIMEKLFLLFKQQNYKEKSIIFPEGTVGKEIYIIYSGQVEIIKNYGKIDEKLLSILNEKELFGEMSLFSTTTRTASALSKTESIIFSINADDFNSVLKNFPNDGLKILEWLLLNMGLRLEQTSKELSAINTISFLIVESLKDVSGTKNFLTKVCNEIYNVIGTNFNVGIYIYNIFSQEFELITTCGENSDNFFATMNIENEFVSTMLNEKTNCVFKQNSIKTFFCPMNYADKIIGFVLVTTKDHFSQDIKNLISSITNLLTVAITNLQQLSEEREKQRFLQMKDRFVI
jgi:CRP-like cAMP-binding protein